MKGNEKAIAEAARNQEAGVKFCSGLSITLPRVQRSMEYLSWRLPGSGLVAFSSLKLESEL